MSSGLILRDYQIEAVYSMIEAAKRVRARGGGGAAERVLVIQPTGAGKTVEMLAFARGVRKHWGWRTLIIVPSVDLLYQTEKSLKKNVPELTCGLVGDGKFDPAGDVVIAIEASLNEGKLRQIPGDTFQAVICDEAHHVAADNYREMLGHFSGAQLIVGMTATFIRGDEVCIASDKYFPTVIVWQTVAQLTRAGWLVEAFGHYKQTNVSLDNVEVRNGEFAERQLSRAVNTEKRNKIAVDAYKEFLDGRPVVAFCVDVAHARAMADCFNDNNVPAAAVWGDMPDDEYKSIMERYATGEILVLPNAKLLCEGWDAPWTAGVLLAFPVTKRAAYVKVPQMFGRMLRPDTASGKVDAVAVELRDKPRTRRGSNQNIAVSGLAMMAGGSESDFVCGRVPIHVQASRNGAIQAWRERRKLLSEFSSEDSVLAKFDVIDRLSHVSAYAWVPLGNALYMPLANDDFIEVVEVTPFSFEVKVCVAGELDDAATSSTREGALYLADQWVGRHVKNKALLLRDTEWRTRKPSEKQVTYAHGLTNLPKNLLYKLTSGQVSDLIKSARALLVQPPLAGMGDEAVGGPVEYVGQYTPHAWQVPA
ncbi:MAG: DEAD/DEAH box helicase [Pyrinomonadaceae bacterium]